MPSPTALDGGCGFSFECEGLRRPSDCVSPNQLPGGGSAPPGFTSFVCMWRCITPRHSNPLTCAEHSLVCSQRIMQYTKLRFDDSNDVFTPSRHFPVNVPEEPGCPGDSSIYRSMWTEPMMGTTLHRLVLSDSSGWRPSSMRTSWTYLCITYLRLHATADIVRKSSGGPPWLWAKVTTVTSCS